MELKREDIMNYAGKAKEFVMNEAILKILIFRGRKAMKDLDNNSRRAVALSEETLLKLLDANKDTEYGKKYGFADIHSVDEYRKKVPLSTYDDYEPYVRRMVDNNEQGLISCEAPEHYALSSGSIGVPKHIPVVKAELDKYGKYGTAMCFGVMDEYYRNTTGRSFKSGFGVNCVELKFQETKYGVPKGAISGNTMKQVKDMTKYFMEPPWDVINPQANMDLKYLRARYALERKDIVFMDAAFMTALVDLIDYMRANWEMLVKDIYHGRINKEVDIPQEWREKFEAGMKPNPKRAKELAREFKKGSDRLIPRIWPDIQFIGSIGTGGFFTYSKKMRRYTGRNVPFNNLSYAASEGLFATARHAGDTSYVLIPDGGFYEFIPAKNDDDSQILTIDQLEEGEDYEIIITNLSGFYRYRIKDVIRVTGFYNESPMVQFVYRKSQMLSIAGEKTNEEAVRWSIEQFMKDTGLVVNDYSVFANTDTQPGHYTFYMEPDRVVPKEDLKKYRDAIEERMMQANPSYGNKIRTGVLSPMELKFVQLESYQLYRDMMITKGTSANQLKPVRVIDTPVKLRFFNRVVEEYED
ncbi:MAG: GH3 auxin-responsive promoter family protein [Lachnospiraceae bacterium]|nr:GH3 auxin-responsive promoter family protein [Lachnospiraceae bacterium]